MAEKHIYFDNLKFTRDDKTGYYRCSKIGERLHRYVWKYYNGDIPKGYQIYHIDGDKSNNDISNLMLIERRKHAQYHSAIKAKNHYDEMIENLNEKARPKAAEWHKSETGRKWHREHALKIAKKMKEKEYVCLQCGKVFSKKPYGTNKFCCNNCKSKYRRASGIDNEKRVCVVCGAEFVVDKYSKTKCCSRSCAVKSRNLDNGICEDKINKNTG